MLSIPVLLVVFCAVLGLAPGMFGQALTEGLDGASGPRGDTASSPEPVPEGLSAADWSSIRAAYEVGRYAAYAVEGGYRAANPGQQWRAYFDGRGLTIEPDAGGWAWGLELLRYGFAGGERDVTNPLRVGAEGQRVAYDWDEVVTEWFVNDGRGLEHGYTVNQRPTAREGGEEPGPLTFVLAVRGELEPEVAADGRGARFLDGAGSAVLMYSGLAVFDAAGDVIPARFECVAGRLLLTVDERGARYPLHIDPIVQQAYLKASNTDVEDWFGYSVAVSGNVVVVSALGEDSSTTGVDGDENDNSATVSGAAYVFVHDGAGWAQEAYLKPSNTAHMDHFGFSVSVSGDVVVVGAPREDSSAIGVDGDDGDDSAPEAGAAYVFVQRDTGWIQEAYLKASNTEEEDLFGWSVSVSGDVVVVGASGEDSEATGVNGDETDNFEVTSGAAYVFRRTGTSWSQEAYLKASNTDGGDRFGTSVAVSGDTVVVGAPREGTSAPYSGAAYVFEVDPSGTGWAPRAYLKASNPDQGDGFANSLAASGDTIVIGATGEDSSANQSDNSADGAGAAYVFRRSGAGWSQEAYLKASNSGVQHEFGYSVAVSDDTVVVGAPMEGSSALSSGAAYVFMWNGTSWSEHHLRASNAESYDFFGHSVAVSGETVVVGASSEGSGAIGVNGDQSDNSVFASGAVYVFGMQELLTSINGDILFVDQSLDVASFLLAHPVDPDPDFAVAAYRNGSPWSVDVAAYTPVNSPAVAASYTMDPDYEAATDVFHMVVDSLLLEGDIRYRVRNLHTGSLTICGPVDPAGITCDIAECAAIVEVTLRLTGDPDDLDMMYTGVPAGDITAQVWDGGLVDQSSRPFNASVADLRQSGGVTVPMLVRGSGEPLVFQSSVTVGTSSGSQVTFFSGDEIVGLGCGETSSIDLEIPVDPSPQVWVELQGDLPPCWSDGPVSFDVDYGSSGPPVSWIYLEIHDVNSPTGPAAYDDYLCMACGTAGIVPVAVPLLGVGSYTATVTATAAVGTSTYEASDTYDFTIPCEDVPVLLQPEIAIATSRRVELFDVVPGTQTQSTQSWSPSGQPYELRFSDDGSRLAVSVGSSGLNLCDLGSALLYPVSGPHVVRAAYRPNDAGFVALVIRPPGASYYEIGYLDGASFHVVDKWVRDAASAASAIPHVPVIDWFDDGSRLAVLSTASVSGSTVDDQMVFAGEYAYGEHASGSGVLKRDVSANRQVPRASIEVGAGLRLEAVELHAAESGEPWYISSSLGLHRLSGLSVVSVADFPAWRIDLSDTAEGIGYLFEEGRAVGFVDVASGTRPGSALGERGFVVAISHDLGLIAVGFRDRVEIYSLPDYELRTTIPVAAPRQLAFRPPTP